MENQNGIVRSLKSLAELQVDRIEGYRKAYEELGTWDLDLKAMFKNNMNQSESQKKELDILLSQCGESDVVAEDSFMAQMHQVWMEIKTAFAKKDRETILSSCEFGENVIIGAYEGSLEKTLTPSVKVTLERQLAELKAAKGAILLLKNAAESV
ncbi:conserved hypothetical protein [Spirosomataceae bacterium TFI 002]|nr:conserved hypothetical protein [Spirosomataceae bacterium TFI 002]